MIWRTLEAAKQQYNTDVKGNASRSGFGSVVNRFNLDVLVLLYRPVTYREECDECSEKDSLAHLDCGSWYRHGGRAASGQAVFMVSTRCVGGSPKWPDKFVAVEGDTTNPAAGLGPGTVLDRGGAARVCGVDRGYVSCSCNSRASFYRSYISDFGHVSTEECASEKGRQRQRLNYRIVGFG